METADKLVAELAIEWFFNIQLVGEHVIEINPRISTIVYQDDLNLPYLGVKRALGEISDEELRGAARRGSGRAGRACATSTRSTSTARSSTRARTRVAERPLRVTLCPVNTAGVPWTNAQALRRRGVDARLVVFERYKLHPEADGRSTRRAAGSLPAGRRRSGAALARLLPRTDVFHFYFGLTLVPKSLQFPILRAARKKSVFHYLGSDIRGKTPEQLAYGKRAGRPGRRQLRRDPLGARGGGDPARASTSRGSRPRRRRDRDAAR